MLPTKRLIAAGIVLCLNAFALASEQINVADTGWHLWPDTKATWQDDKLYLPDETADVSALPVNPPTGGWKALSEQTGVAVTLPSTVEQHFWGKFGLRPLEPDEYGYAPGTAGKPLEHHKADPDAQAGNYKGVSWWWTTVDVPASFRDKTALLHIRGARQRAEVFVNQKLCGYDLIAETSFDCDVTQALRPGEKNQIAIRITNPGGRFDWIDYNTLKWGKYEFHAGHGFGGLDRGITLTAHDPIYIDDTWVLNTAQPHDVTVHAAVRNHSKTTEHARVRFDITKVDSDEVLASSETTVELPANELAEVSKPLSYAAAELWTPDHPSLYRLKVHLANEGTSPIQDNQDRPFGFRAFEPRGIGSQAGLFLNDQRVRLYTAISWNYWGFNGLWPTPELAKKEVLAAKRLNLNMLNFHRDIGREEVFAQQDQLGLLRYVEPGGGGGYFRKIGKGATQPSAPETSGKGGEAKTFAEKYMLARVERMVKQFRSHPSLAVYVLQNETEPDFNDPHLFYLLRRVHELDPSRVVAAKSGISFNNQAWFAPYASEPMCDDGTGYSGWRDRHTVGGPGVWQDNLYKNPTEFVNQLDDPKEIVDWGEMLGVAVADNHPQMVEQIKAGGGDSYDLQVHESLAAAYHVFLDRWKFRDAFPTDEAFFAKLGNKEYEFWGRVIEASRLSESNAILTISGWESTAIENHSGLVDNLRNFHGDPNLLAPKLAPLLPVVIARGSVIKAGDKTKCDVFWLNETGHSVGGTLRVSLLDPKGATTEVGSYTVPAYVKDRFVYPIAAGVESPVLQTEGTYRLRSALDSDPNVKNEQSLLAVRDVSDQLAPLKLGLIGEDADAAATKLAPFKSLTVTPFGAGQKYDLLVVATGMTSKKKKQDTGAPEAAKTAEPTVELPPILSDDAVASIKAGTPLLMLAGDEDHAARVLKDLAATGAIEYRGTVPTARASWMGNWIFVRKHPLFAGLLVDKVMTGDYQTSVKNGFGVMVDGANVDVVAGYGRDHDAHIGCATFTTKLGSTPIVFQAMPGFQTVIEQRMLANAIGYLTSSDTRQDAVNLSRAAPPLTGATR